MVFSASQVPESPAYGDAVVLASNSMAISTGVQGLLAKGQMDQIEDSILTSLDPIGSWDLSAFYKYIY